MRDANMDATLSMLRAHIRTGEAMGITDYLIKKAVQAAILLALCGELKSTTLFFIEQALVAQKRGLISLSDLNYQLQGKEKYRESIGWLDKKRCRN